MSRIVAGSAGGRKLEVPPRGTRPTSDRVREAVFSSLGSILDFDGCSVLDLYAGSGALGIESLSRGAEYALLVESDRKAARIISLNVQSVGVSRAEVVAASVESVLSGPGSVRFGLVFLDPPYAVDGDTVTKVLTLLVENNWLREDGVVVVERSTRSPETVWPSALTPIKTKKYGETRIDMAQNATSIRGAKLLR